MVYGAATRVGAAPYYVADQAAGLLHLVGRARRGGEGRSDGIPGLLWPYGEEATDEVAANWYVGRDLAEWLLCMQAGSE